MKTKQLNVLSIMRLAKEINLPICDDYKFVEDMHKLKLLARKDHAICELDCNGEGWLRGTFYTCGDVEHEKSEHPTWPIKSAYEGGYEENIFARESGKIAEKIRTIVSKYPFLKVEFQGDPRGNTVKVELADTEQYIDLELF